MTRLESHIIELNQSPEAVYAFLQDLSNHEKLLPEQVENWKVDGDTCEYTIRGTGSVHLRIKERLENEVVSLEPNGRIPFPFELSWYIDGSGEKTKVVAVMEAELNPVLKLIAAGPLRNFISMQVDNLKKYMDGIRSKG